MITLDGQDILDRFFCNVGDIKAARKVWEKLRTDLIEERADIELIQEGCKKFPPLPMGDCKTCKYNVKYGCYMGKRPIGCDSWKKREPNEKEISCDSCARTDSLIVSGTSVVAMCDSCNAFRLWAPK